jgi:hypothetical protein
MTDQVRLCALRGGGNHPYGFSYGEHVIIDPTIVHVG